MEKLKNYEKFKGDFSEMELAVFDFTKKMATAAYEITDEEIGNLKRWFNDAELVELVEVACHVISLSKFNPALDLEIW